MTSRGAATYGLGRFLLFIGWAVVLGSALFGVLHYQNVEDGRLGLDFDGTTRALYVWPFVLSGCLGLVVIGIGGVLKQLGSWDRVDISHRPPT